MGLKITPTFENEIEDAVTDICGNMRPSKKTLNAIMQFAASYECVSTRIGRFGMILN